MEKIMTKTRYHKAAVIAFVVTFTVSQLLMSTRFRNKIRNLIYTRMSRHE